MFTTLLSIWILHLASMATPGANVLLVSQLAASDRTQSAVFAALGITLGGFLWASSAVLGVRHSRVPRHRYRAAPRFAWVF